ncbi:MAG: fibronectin type III domain-containing protein [Cyclobacteriaceae bacterium]
MTRIKTILFFLLTVTSLMSEGQVFPVQSTVQLTPPYSLYLSDYAAPGSERLRVTAFLIDATRPELNVRIRLRIEGNGIKIETKPEFMPPPVTLLGGVPLQLISSDLAAYFDPRNLNFTGITQREIEQRGALPEGLYQFCFEVIEYNRGVKISNTGCAVAWLILNDPPIVNVPADNEKIRIQDPQQVIFQWTPRHRGTPNSAFNAEYDFKLVEVWPSTRNPNDAILTSPVIFQTTTSETTIIYGPAETPLEPGRRYAFQLRAHAYAGADELSLFKNNGYSQVYTFVYGDACLPPKNILVSDVGTTRFNVSWDGASNQTTYALRYRLSPVASAKGDMSTSAKETPLSSAKATESAWYTNQSLTPNVTVNSLQPNTRYEFQVNAGCGTFTSDYSLVTNVTTKDNPGIQYSCGVPLTPFNLDPSQLINSLKVGDVIKAGDFDVVLSKVSGSNGTFSGEGVIEVSYFNQAKVKAEFTNINVNNEMRMVNGYMNVTGAGVEVIPAGVMNLMDNLDEALAQADKALDEYEANLPQQFDENAAVTSTLITVPGTATVTPGSNGSVVIVDGSGRRTEVPAGTTASVVDSSGKGYIIDSKGKVHTTTAAIATAAAKREYNLKLKFAEAQDQKFGFDAKRYDPIASTYTKVEDQFLSWKSVATGQLDKVLATLEGTGIDKSKIRFELNGSVVNSQWSLVNGGSTSITNDQSTISILGAGDGVESELIALYDAQAPVTNDNSPVTKTKVLAKLSVITYDQIVKELVIVPVNGN